MKPTQETYDEMQLAFDHFNLMLFGGQLPACLITLQRRKHTYGYFCASRFVNQAAGLTTDEIAMNPAYFATCSPEEFMQTLVHEMVHLWQHHFGQPGRRGYHNREWADQMEAVGLVPSSTGRPGGKRTGDRMGDYILDRGGFEDACRQLLTKNFRISWADNFPAKNRSWQVFGDGTLSELEGEGHLIAQDQAKPTRTKFSCPQCSANAWGKPGLNLVCGDCGVAFEVKSRA